MSWFGSWLAGKRNPATALCLKDTYNIIPFHAHVSETQNPGHVPAPSQPLNQGHMLLAHWEDGFLSGALRGSFQCFRINLAMESVPWLWRRVSEVSRDQQCGLFPVRSDFVVFIWCLFATQLHIETGLPSAPTQLPRPSPASDADSDSWSSCLMSFRRLPFPFESPGVRQQLL